MHMCMCVWCDRVQCFTGWFNRQQAAGRRRYVNCLHPDSLTWLNKHFIATAHSSLTCKALSRLAKPSIASTTLHDNKETHSICKEWHEVSCSVSDIPYIKPRRCSVEHVHTAQLFPWVLSTADRNDQWDWKLLSPAPVETLNFGESTLAWVVGQHSTIHVVIRLTEQDRSSWCVSCHLPDWLCGGQQTLMSRIP